ncbi:MAG: helix-turn-helix transcriptional regulator [Myxococcota bacterium]
MRRDERDRAVMARVGERVRRYRKEARLTQEDLSARSEVSVKEVSTIETGKQSPTITTLSRLARALGRSVRDLVDEEGADASERALAGILASEVRALSPTERTKARRVLVAALRAFAGDETDE